jgi:hypothetical protein
VAASFVISPAGAYTKLAPLAAGRSAFAQGISSDGTVTGYAETESDTLQGVVWSPGAYDAPVVLTGIDPDQAVWVIGMSPNGTVAAGTSSGQSFVWSKDLEIEELPKPQETFDVGVKAISNRYAAGIDFDPATGTNRTLRWRLGESDVETIETPLITINAVNRRGVIGGMQFDDARAVLVVGTHVRRLTQLNQGANEEVRAVSNSGDAAGSSWFEGTSTAVVWTCS